MVGKPPPNWWVVYVIRVPSYGDEASSTGDHSQYAEGTENIMSEVSYDDESSNTSNYSGPVDLSEGARKVFTDLDQMDFAPVAAPKQVIEVLVDGKMETYEIQPAEVYGSDLSFENSNSSRTSPTLYSSWDESSVDCCYIENSQQFASPTTQMNHTPWPHLTSMPKIEDDQKATP